MYTFAPRSGILTTETMTIAPTSSSDSNHIISNVTSNLVSTSHPSFSVTPPPTSRSNTDFIYVEYDYEYSSYEDPSVPSESTDILSTTPTPTTTATAATISTSTTHPKKNAPPHLFQKKTTTPTIPPVTLSMVTIDGPQPSITTSADTDYIITSTSSPQISSGGEGLEAKFNQTESEPVPTSSSSFIPLTKKENNSVDEVPYQIVGVDGDITRGQQNFFVPRMPPFRERTQNKRIQELLNEKRRQDLLKRMSRSREGQTDRKQPGL